MVESTTKLKQIFAQTTKNWLMSFDFEKEIAKDDFEIDSIYVFIKLLLK